MKAEADRKTLAKKLKYISEAVQDRAVLPALSGFLMKFKSDRIEITGGNADIIIRTQINCDDVNKVKEEGGYIFPKLLLRIIEKADDEKVKFSTGKSGNMTVTVGGAKYRLTCGDENSYPRAPYVEDGITIDAGAEELCTAIKSTVGFASDDEKKPSILGVNIRSLDGHLQFTGTDSYAVARYTSDINTDDDLDISIPPKPAKVLAKLLDGETLVKLSVNSKKTRLQADTDEYRFLIRTSAERFFSADKVFALYSKGTDQFTADTSELLSALDRLSIFKSEHNVVKFSMQKSNSDSIELQSSLSQIGNCHDVVTGAYRGNDLTVYLSFQYLKEMLRSMKANDIEMTFLGELSPTFVKSKENPKYIGLILPVRVV